MRIKTIRRRCRASGICEREIRNIHSKMKGMPDYECKPGGKYVEQWRKAISEAIVY